MKRPHDEWLLRGYNNIEEMEKKIVKNKCREKYNEIIKKKKVL